jgi:hypothetical protein
MDRSVDSLRNKRFAAVTTLVPSHGVTASPSREIAHVALPARFVGPRRQIANDGTSLAAFKDWGLGAVRGDEFYAEVTS